jgi:hypothetical protein
MAIADKLLPGFLEVDNHPVFFVYETGLLEIVTRLLASAAGPRTEDGVTSSFVSNFERT